MGHRSKFVNFDIFLSKKIGFYLSKQTVQTLMKYHIRSIWSGFSQFAKVPVYRYPEWKGLIMLLVLQSLLFWLFLLIYNPYL